MQNGPWGQKQTSKMIRRAFNLQTYECISASLKTKIKFTSSNHKLPARENEFNKLSTEHSRTTQRKARPEDGQERAVTASAPTPAPHQPTAGSRRASRNTSASHEHKKLPNPASLLVDGTRPNPAETTLVDGSRSQRLATPPDRR